MGTVAYYRHAWTDKIQRFIAVPEHGEEIFLAAFFFYMIVASLQTTMFRVGGPVVTAVKFLLTGCVLFKIIAFDRYSEKELCFAALLLGNAVVVMALSGYKEVFYFAVFLLGAKNIDFEKILKIYLLVTIAVLLSAFVDFSSVLSSTSVFASALSALLSSLVAPNPRLSVLVLIVSTQSCGIIFFKGST